MKNSELPGLPRGWARGMRCHSWSACSFWAPWGLRQINLCQGFRFSRTSLFSCVSVPRIWFQGSQIWNVCEDHRDRCWHRMLPRKGQSLPQNNTFSCRRRSVRQPCEFGMTRSGWDLVKLSSSKLFLSAQSQKPQLSRRRFCWRASPNFRPEGS